MAAVRWRSGRRLGRSPRCRNGGFHLLKPLPHIVTFNGRDAVFLRFAPFADAGRERRCGHEERARCILIISNSPKGLHIGDLDWGVFPVAFTLDHHQLRANYIGCSDCGNVSTSVSASWSDGDGVAHTPEILGHQTLELPPVDGDKSIRLCGEVVDVALIEEGCLLEVSIPQATSLR